MITYAKYLASLTKKLAAEYVGVDEIIEIKGLEDIILQAHVSFEEDETEWFSYKSKNFLLSVFYDFNSHRITIDEFSSKIDEAKVFGTVASSLVDFAKKFDFIDIEIGVVITGYHIKENIIVISRK